MTKKYFRVLGIALIALGLLMFFIYAVRITGQVVGYSSSDGYFPSLSLMFLLVGYLVYNYSKVIESKNQDNN